MALWELNLHFVCLCPSENILLIIQKWQTPHQAPPPILRISGIICNRLSSNKNRMRERMMFLAGFAYIARSDRIRILWLSKQKLLVESWSIDWCGEMFKMESFIWALAAWISKCLFAFACSFLVSGNSVHLQTSLQLNLIGFLFEIYHWRIPRSADSIQLNYIDTF